MAIKFDKGEERPILPEGNHLARLYSVVEIGTVPVAYREEPARQIRLTWELPEETAEFDGVQKPLVIGNKYTASMYKESKLRKIVEGMTGKLDDKEADDFDLQTLLGKACMLNVVHTVGKNGKTYANVASAAPLPKAIKEVPEQFNPSVWLDYQDGWSEEVYGKLPAWVQREMQESQEMVEKEPGYSKKDEAEDPLEGESPF